MGPRIYKEKEYKDTIEASTIVPPGLRALLYDVKQAPKSTEEEVWGELLEERMNLLSETRGSREYIEVGAARKEFVREYCMNRGIENPETGIIAELEDLRAQNLLPSRVTQIRTDWKKFRSSSKGFLVFLCFGGSIWWSMRNKRLEQEENYRKGKEEVAELLKTEEGRLEIAKMQMLSKADEFIDELESIEKLQKEGESKTIPALQTLRDQIGDVVRKAQ